jgi:hypothetical protein
LEFGSGRCQRLSGLDQLGWTIRGRDRLVTERD